MRERSVTIHPSNRRGVSSVLAMMFLVIFGSLAAAMAVVAQGNLRTADSHMRVNRAMSAAETGLIFASRRLESESRRFASVIGVIEDTYGSTLWNGPVPTDGDPDTWNLTTDSVHVFPPSGYSESTLPDSLGEALLHAHQADTHSVIVEASDAGLPALSGAGGTEILKVRPIALTAHQDGTPNADGPYFRLKYQLVIIPNESAFVRVTSQGVDGAITRTLTMDHQIEKQIDFAGIGPSRFMIGKNVRVEGPLGTRYGIAPADEDNDTIVDELDSLNGDPLVVRSDFYYLDPTLDAMLDDFYDQVVAHDVDGDNRLRIWHPEEAVGLTGGSYTFTDWNGDEYVDDMDLFMMVFDNAPTDQAVIYDAAAGPVEFSGDLQLAHLIDSANPDRNGDGFAGDATDTLYGYLDGKIDIYDNYKKINGTLSFAVQRAKWDFANNASYQTVVQGPISPGLDEPPVRFEVPDEELRELTTGMFTTSGTWYDTQVGGSPNLTAQVAAAVPSFPGETPEFIPGGAGTNWESIPFEAPGAYDFYDRPIYRNYRFTNLRIAQGTNALFEGCVFDKVTYIETETDNSHENWNYIGALEQIDDSPPTFEEKYPGIPCELSDGTPVTDTKSLSNNLRFHNCFVTGVITGDRPDEYTHWRNKVFFGGNTVWFTDPQDPELLAMIAAGDTRGTQIQNLLLAHSTAEAFELSKASILLPGWSIDVGNFTNDTSGPPTKLKGANVAGIIDARGSVIVEGIMINTQRSALGVGPLFYGGLTDHFNATIGFFGPSDGDGEGMDVDDPDFPGFGEIVIRKVNSPLPDGIPWSISVNPSPDTYWEGGDVN